MPPGIWDFSEDTADQVLEAWEEFSRGIRHELSYAREALAHFEQGTDLPEATLPRIHLSKKKAAGRMVGLGRFMARTVETAIHTKEWHIARTAAMPAIAEAECDNTRRTIPLVEFDSHLGYEPSMEYMCDHAHLEWKIDITQKVLKEKALPKIK